MLDFNPQSYSPDGVAIFGTDAQLLVKFYVHSELSVYRSKTEGRPIHSDVTMVEVITPGEREPVRQLANEWHKIRFRKQWEAFEKGQESRGTGTPLEQLFPAEPTTVKDLQAFNVYTVEQLANISDSAMTQLPMGRSLSDRAKKYISTASHGAEFHQLTKAVEDQARMIEDLKAQLAAKPAAVATEDTQVRRGPGRPRNTPQEGTA